MKKILVFLLLLTSISIFSEVTEKMVLPNRDAYTPVEENGKFVYYVEGKKATMRIPENYDDALEFLKLALGLYLSAENDVSKMIEVGDKLIIDNTIFIEKTDAINNSIRDLINYKPPEEPLFNHYVYFKAGVLFDPFILADVELKTPTVAGVGYMLSIYDSMLVGIEVCNPWSISVLGGFKFK